MEFHHSFELTYDQLIVCTTTNLCDLFASPGREIQLFQSLKSLLFLDFGTIGLRNDSIPVFLWKWEVSIFYIYNAGGDYKQNS